MPRPSKPSEGAAAKAVMDRSRVASIVFLLVGFCLGSRAIGDDLELKIEGKVAFTEGPAWHAETGNVYFSDIENNRIMRRDPSGRIHVFRVPSGRANGLFFDGEGRLIACEGHREGGNRRVTRTEKDGSITVLTDRFGGLRYNSPNDVVVDSRGGIYFTDPRYGDRGDLEIFDDNGKAIEGVYRIDPEGNVSRVISHEVDRPNGIALSQDERFLFVADNNNDRAGTNRKIWRFDRNEDGSLVLESRKELFDWKLGRGPDGFCVGDDGKLYVTAGLNFPNLPAENGDHPSGIYVIEPEGGLDKFIAVPADMITNCTFGGQDGKTLFVTAGHFLWSLRP